MTLVDSQTDRQTDRQTDSAFDVCRQSDRQTVGHAAHVDVGRQTVGQQTDGACRQTDGHTAHIDSQLIQRGR